MNTSKINNIRLTTTLTLSLNGNVSQYDCDNESLLGWWTNAYEHTKINNKSPTIEASQRKHVAALLCWISVLCKYVHHHFPSFRNPCQNYFWNKSLEKWKCSSSMKHHLSIVFVRGTETFIPSTQYFIKHRSVSEPVLDTQSHSCINSHMDGEFDGICNF